ncbi:hypothetical protein LTR05_000533 [Lithohypha guttulata]|uniref:Uncharacterized protein n=1 Tax=Lithohypha guttulata TaxID=1690604 RepID=A0AAN7YKG1_9EURO|nr:hypothetical protein LTR05_000533 [Lithohypha guttulata]
MHVHPGAYCTTPFPCRQLHKTTTAMGGRATRGSTAKSAPKPSQSNKVNARSLRPNSNPNTPATSSKKKKRNLIDLTQDDEDEVESSHSSAKKAKQVQEKRLKMFRKQAPQSFLTKLERATSQRMVVIGRTRSGEGEDLHEDIDIVGTTGNIYTVTVGRLPSCTCPDHLKGNECKHKVYALAVVLQAPYEYQYQRALLTPEVHQLLADAPQIPYADADTKEDSRGKRKPIEGECPICYMDFDPDNNELVWCKAACGNNMHKSCFDQWAASQRGQGVKCVYCRTPWQNDQGDLASIKSSGVESGEGYVNVADQFGISRARDCSSYHQPWARRNFGYG